MRFVTPRIVAEEEAALPSHVARLFLKHSNKAFRKPAAYVAFLLSPFIGYAVGKLALLFWPEMPGVVVACLSGGIFGLVFTLAVFSCVEEHVVAELRGEKD